MIYVLKTTIRTISLVALLDVNLSVLVVVIILASIPVAIHVEYNVILNAQEEVATTGAILTVLMIV